MRKGHLLRSKRRATTLARVKHPLSLPARPLWRIEALDERYRVQDRRLMERWVVSDLHGLLEEIREAT